MSVSTSQFGSLNGEVVWLHTITSGALRAEIISYGGRLRSLVMPDHAGRNADIALGFETIDDYLASAGSGSAICGRFANRIAGGRFELNGRVHQLSVNDPANGNHVHGGFYGLARKNWKSEAIEGRDAVRLWLTSRDGDEGYPGCLEASATYELILGNRLRITLEATCDRDTPINLIFHGYWNLGGPKSGDVLGHFLRLNADHYLPVNAAKIPTGAIAPVEHTPFDFRRAKLIGQEIEGVPGGYDHNVVFGREPTVPLREVARLADPVSGRALTMASNQPGAQIYSGHHWRQKPVTGRGGVRYGNAAGVAIETQAFPNAPNEAGFPNAILRTGKKYRNEIEVELVALAPSKVEGFLAEPWSSTARLAQKDVP